MFARKHARNTERQLHSIRQHVQNTLLTGTDSLYISQLRLILEKSLHERRENSTGTSVSESTNDAIFLSTLWQNTMATKGTVGDSWLVTSCALLFGLKHQGHQVPSWTWSVRNHPSGTQGYCGKPNARPGPGDTV